MTTLRRVSHDMSMVYGERHALSADCPCGPDLEVMGEYVGVYYHFLLEDRVSRSQPSTQVVGTVETQDRETPTIKGAA